MEERVDYTLPRQNILISYQLRQLATPPHLWFNFFNIGVLSNIYHYIILPHRTSVDKYAPR